MYPALPYMERVAMKDDIIPLREPVRLENGQVVSEIPVTAGQVSSLLDTEVVPYSC